MPRRMLLLLTLAAVTAFPVIALVIRALGSAWFFPSVLPDVQSPLALVAFGTEARIWRSGGVSALLAALTGIVAAALALVAGRAVARARGRVRRLAEAGAFLPVVAPPIALGIGVQIFALQLGVAGSMAGVLLAHLIPATGYLILYFTGVLSVHDWALEDEARTLGARPLQIWTRITLPVLAPRIAEAVLLGALVSWGQLSLTLVVGGGAVRTLPVELLAFVRSGDDYLAAAAALILSLPPVLAITTLARAARRAGTAA